MNLDNSAPLRRLSGLGPLLAMLAACGDGGSPDAMAFAEGEELTVADAVALLENQPALPANRPVVRALADLWVDYTLLARATAEDSSLASLDVDVLIQQRIDQEMILALREAVIQVDTVLDDEELRFLYQQEEPGASVRARHILFHFDQTRPASRDSVMAVANAVRQRLVEGGDFAALASEYSKDPGSAAQGGDLGAFTRERMVAPFSDAAFALEPGEVSEPVETMFGVHLIRVDGREVPEFEDLKDGFRNAIKNERIARAESAYVAGIEEPAQPQLQEGALAIARTISADPGSPLPRRAASKALVEYEGGVYTVGELQQFLQNQSPAYRTQVTEATDQQLEVALMGLTRGKLLVESARAEGLAPDPSTVDSIRALARADIVDAARRLGVIGSPGADDPQGTIRTALAEMLRGDKDVIPLGQVGYTLRGLYSAGIVNAGIDEASRLIGEQRAQVPVAPPSFPGAADPAPTAVESAGEAGQPPPQNPPEGPDL